MSESQEIRLTLSQESDYVFRVAFDETSIPDLLTDEPAPLGGGSGPNPTRLLAAAVANCLSASLLFALRKYKNAPAGIETRATATLGRDADKRLRVEHIGVTIALPDAAADYAQLTRLLEQFEQFCVVTQSVRAGIAIDVSVVDAGGQVVHGAGR